MNLGIGSFPRGIGDLMLWLVPIGTGHDWWGDETDVPRGYILPAGQDIEQSKYPRLYAKWCKSGVHKYGAGSTPTSTKAPDKRGRVSVAKDDMGGTAANLVTSGGSGIAGNTLGATGGAETVAISEAQLATHAHGGIFLGGGGAGVTGGSGRTLAYSTNNDGSGVAHQNMSPAIVCNYIIRAG